MRLSRRDLLRFGGSACVALVTGCSAAPNNGTPRARATLKVRLVGPDVDRVLFNQTTVRSVGPIQSQNGQIHLEATLSKEGMVSVNNVFQSVDVDNKPGAFEIVVVDRQQEKNRFGVSPSLANRIANEDWQGEFRMTFEKRSDAKTVRKTLTCGKNTAQNSCDSR
jgi:hypothetical protein